MIGNRKPPSRKHAEKLYELATLIHAVARHLPAPSDLEPGPCTRMEIDVMRQVGARPGCSAGVAAQAVGLPTSNFSRVLKGLVSKGLIRREVDERDARTARLYPTALAGENRRRMRDAWSQALHGAPVEAGALDGVLDALRLLDAHLSPESPVDLAATRAQ